MGSKSFWYFIGLVTSVLGSQAIAAPTMEIVLKPLSTAGEITKVQVEQRVAGIAGEPGKTLFSLPDVVQRVRGQPYGASDITASDAHGALSFVVEVDPENPSPVRMRRFMPTRTTFGPIQLSYAADVKPALSPKLPGPSYDLRGIDGAFGGAPYTFILAPAAGGPIDFKLKWDFNALPPGSRGESVFGHGDVERTLNSGGGLSTMFFLAGKVFGQPTPGSLFRLYWIGQPPFDVPAAAKWSEKSFSALQTFFKEPAGAPYTLLMRPYARPRDGGGATTGGFMLEYGAGYMSDEARRIMFTHEMIHHFVGGLTGDYNRNAWFGEGLAEFYKTRIPVRAGLLDMKDAAREIGTMTEAYYREAGVRAAAGEPPRPRNPSAYSGGHMYFVSVNAAVRAKSGGKRSLDDLVLAMIEGRRAGQPYDEKRWRELLLAELGPEGPAQLDRFYGGEFLTPPDNAFGPCFTRTYSRHPSPALGFSEDAFLMEPKVVRNLQAASAAANAGLRDGDEVVSFKGARARVAHSASNIELDPMVEVTVRRPDGLHTVKFSAEGPPMDEYRWNLKPGAKTCGL